jgi:DNA repair exonuclease SbcCD ATPase subunit
MTRTGTPHGQGRPREEATGAELVTAPAVADVAAGHVGAVRAALASNDGLAALTALGEVLSWAAEVLGAEPLRSPAAAFNAVAATDQALSVAPSFFAALWPVVERAEPAEQVAADLHRHEERLAELVQRAAPLRERLAALSRAEQRHTAEIQAHGDIVKRIAELERIERLAAGVADLRIQRDLLEQRTQAVAEMVAGAESDLAAAGERLITLTADLLNGLTAQTHDVLRRARDQDRLLEARLAECHGATERAASNTERLREELAAAETQAEAAQAEFEQVRSQADARLAALRRYATADRAIGTALAGGDPPADGDPGLGAQVLAALDRVEDRLTEIDELLKTLLNERTSERAPLRPAAPGAKPAPEED